MLVLYCFVSFAERKRKYGTRGKLSTEPDKDRVARALVPDASETKTSGT